MEPRSNSYLLVSLLIVLSCDTSHGVVTLRTKLGNITGLLMSVTDGTNTIPLNSFRNIPFAKAPVGDLRFRNPEPFGSWNDTLDATMFGPSCVQAMDEFTESLLQNPNVSEDCLQLNIYQPVNASSENKKSVMIWIHGGGYIVGQGTAYDGSYLAAFGDVIVVTINYRLGLFGFLSTMDSVSPGNYGLFDQKLAIEWVFNNIDDYGGDKTSITIFGESAGGFSVGLQSLNPDNEGFFKRAIFQSGIGNSFLSTVPIPRYQATMLSDLTNCPTLLNTDTLDCLRRKSSDDLLLAFVTMVAMNYADPSVHVVNMFAPVVDGVFLRETPQNIIKNKSPGFQFFKSLDVIVGTCEAEGSLLISEIQGRNTTVEKIPWEYLCDNIVSPFVADYYQNLTNLIKPICDFYKSSGSVDEQSLQAVDFFGDVWFYAPAVQSLNLHASESNKQRYKYLSTRSSFFSLGQYGPTWFNGSGHASELPFLFPFFPLASASADDKLTSLTFMKYWSNFAKTGNVNGEDLPVWPQYETTSKQYVAIDASVVTAKDLYKERTKFWLETFPSLLAQTTSSNSSVLSVYVWGLALAILTLIGFTQNIF